MGICYFALVPLSLWTGGERREFAPGDLLPEDTYPPGSAATRAAIHAGEIAPLPAALAEIIKKPRSTASRSRSRKRVAAAA